MFRLLQEFKSICWPKRKQVFTEYLIGIVGLSVITTIIYFLNLLFAWLVNIIFK